MEGTIKWYKEKKGFGFVTNAEHGDIFFHKSGIKSFGHFGLQKDDPVTFDLKETNKGVQAVNVAPAKPA